MLIAVVNESTLVPDSDVYDMCLAVNHQLRHHVAPAWGMLAPELRLSAFTPTEPGTVALGVLDDADQADALGWHTESAAGVVYGRVFARPVLDNGGDIMSRPLSVSSVLSHEAIEVLLDPACNAWADDGAGTWFAREGCDAVESDAYPVTLSAGTTSVTAMVSDFLLPSWFDPLALPGAGYDYLKILRTPFQIRPTGYAIVMQSGQVSAVYGRRYPAWRKATKTHPIARTARRLGPAPGRPGHGPGGGHGHGKPG